MHLNDTKKSLKPTTLSNTLLHQHVKELKSLIISSQLTREQIERHASLVKTKFTHPPGSWMKQLDIVDLQKKRDNYRFLAHHSIPEENCAKFRDIRNKLK